MVGRDLILLTLGSGQTNRHHLKTIASFWFELSAGKEYAPGENFAMG
jgi:hypothetical protein